MADISVQKLKLNPFSKKTYQQQFSIHKALEHAEENDRLLLGVTGFYINEPLNIDQSIQIIGTSTSPPFPSKTNLQIKENGVGIHIQKGSAVKLEHFQLTQNNNTIGIVVDPLFEGDLVLEGLIQKETNLQFDDETPIVLQYRGKGQLTIHQCQLKNIRIQAPEANITITDSTIGDVKTPSEIKCNKLYIANSTILNIHLHSRDQINMMQSITQGDVAVYSRLYAEVLGFQFKNAIGDSYLYLYGPLQATLNDCIMMYGDHIYVEDEKKPLRRSKRSLFQANKSEIWITAEHDNFTPYTLPSKTYNSTVVLETNATKNNIPML